MLTHKRDKLNKACNLIIERNLSTENRLNSKYKLKTTKAIFQTTTVKGISMKQVTNHNSTVKKRDKLMTCAVSLSAMITFTALPLFSLNSLAAQNGIALFDQKQYQQASQVFKSNIENKQSLAQSHFYLGRIALKKHNFKQAVTNFEQAVEQTIQQGLSQSQSPEQNNKTGQIEKADYHYWLGVANAEMLQRSSIFKKPGYAKATQKTFERAVELNGKHLKAMQALVVYYLEAPSIVGGSDKKALAMAEKISQVSQLDGLLAELKVYSNQSDTEKTQQIIAKLTTLDTLSPSANVELGFHYQAQEDYDKAIAYFTQATLNNENESQPASPEHSQASVSKYHQTNRYYQQLAYYQIGRTAMFADNYYQQGINALTHYRMQELNENLPDKNWADYRLASLYQMANNSLKAKELFDQLTSKELEADLKRNVKRAMRKL